MKLILLAAAAALALPAAFAQAIPEDATAIVGANRTLTPSNSAVMQRAIPGAAIAQERGVVQVIALDGTSSTNVMGAGPAPGDRYWWNVPTDIDQRADFRRYRALP